MSFIAESFFRILRLSAEKLLAGLSEAAVCYPPKPETKDWYIMADDLSSVRKMIRGLRLAEAGGDVSEAIEGYEANLAVIDRRLATLTPRERVKFEDNLWRIRASHLEQLDRIRAIDAHLKFHQPEEELSEGDRKVRN